MAKVATSMFQTFGLRHEWLVDVMNKGNEWFESNSLGNMQVHSMLSWLRETGLLHKRNEFSNLFRELVKYRSKLSNQNIWEVLLYNLYTQLPLVRWFFSDLPRGEDVSSKELERRIMAVDPANKARTTNNAVRSLINLFDAMPQDVQQQYVEIRKKGSLRIINIKPYIHVSDIGMIYCIYRYSELVHQRRFTVKRLYNTEDRLSPINLFNVSNNDFVKLLRRMEHYKLGHMELIADLDNITIDEWKAYEVFQHYFIK